MKVIGHRGSSSTAPENTLAAFDLAWREGAAGIEFDVQLTSDNRVVVFHDEDLRRTGGLNRLVRGMSFDEIRKADVGLWKGAAWAGQRVPTLEEVVDGAPKDGLLFIEIKCGPEAVGPIAEILRRIRANMDRIIFVGFSLDAMKRAKEAFPTCRVLWNVEISGYTPGYVGPAAGEVVRLVREWRLDGAGLGFGKDVDGVCVRCVADAGLTTFLWTVDRPEQALAAAACGAMYLASNCPATILRGLQQEKP